jgi:two-component system, sensor histidine kinase YesM
VSIENYMDKNILKTKKKEKIFGKQAIHIIWSLLAFIFFLISAFAIIGYFLHIISSGFMFVLLILTGILISIVVFVIQKTLVLPYLNCRMLFKKFTQDEVYQELIANQYLIFEEQQKVLKHFDSLLDEKSMIKLSTKQAELLALQNQINPHFLYNTLEAIRSDALCAGMDSIANTTEALATFFRYTITDMGTLVTVEDELDNVENYFKIQQYRFGEKFTMNVDYSVCDEILSLKLPKLTLQPFVENAIFHGLESKAEGGNINISLQISSSNLFISVQDDGIGIPEEKLNEINYKLEHISISSAKESPEQKGGIALNNIARRIKLLFGENYGLHIYSISGMGTDIRIKIPIIR